MNPHDESRSAQGSDQPSQRPTLDDMTAPALNSSSDSPQNTASIDGHTEVTRSLALDAAAATPDCRLPDQHLVEPACDPSLEPSALRTETLETDTLRTETQDAWSQRLQHEQQVEAYLLAAIEPAAPVETSMQRSERELATLGLVEQTEPTTIPDAKDVSLKNQEDSERVQTVAVATESDPLPDSPLVPTSSSETQPQQLAYSTLLSLLVVLVLILTIRFTVPPLVESLRYSWHHGQLRAEYELSGQRLQSVSLSSLSETSELVSRRVGPSVVHINLLVSEEMPSRVFTRSPERVQIVGQGSGVVLDTAGHILTNQHVVEDPDELENGRIEVSLSDGRRVVAEKIGIDKATDLAVIKVNASGLLPVEWGDSDKVDVGSPVWAVGSPFGLERTVTFGIVSGKHRMDLRGTRWESRGTNDPRNSTIYKDLMQSDVAVNPGNSGGPLVNSLGQIVGINTAILGENYMGISFSIPSHVARHVAERLIAEGEVRRGWLGVTLRDPEVDTTSDAVPVGGALVVELPIKNSPAKVAGIKAGDLIIKFDGKEIPNHRTLVLLVGKTEVGSTVPVEILREGQSYTINVTIGQSPVAP